VSCYLPATQYVSSLSVHSVHVNVSHFSRDTHEHFIRPMVSTPRCEFRGLQNLHKNAAAALLQKVHNVHRPILWHSWHGFELCIIDSATHVVNVPQCAFMSKDDFLLIQFDCRLYIGIFQCVSLALDKDIKSQYPLDINLPATNSVVSVITKLNIVTICYCYYLPKTNIQMQR